MSKAQIGILVRDDVLTTPTLPCHTNQCLLECARLGHDDVQKRTQASTRVNVQQGVARGTRQRVEQCFESALERDRLGRALFQSCQPELRQVIVNFILHTRYALHRRRGALTASA